MNRKVTTENAAFALDYVLAYPDCLVRLLMKDLHSTGKGKFGIFHDEEIDARFRGRWRNDNGCCLRLVQLVSVVLIGGKGHITRLCRCKGIGATDLRLCIAYNFRANDVRQFSESIHTGRSCKES